MNKAAQALGRLGGKARNEALSAKERSEIARKGGIAKAKKARSVGRGRDSGDASYSPKIKQDSGKKALGERQRKRALVKWEAKKVQADLDRIEKELEDCQRLTAADYATVVTQ